MEAYFNTKDKQALKAKLKKHSDFVAMLRASEYYGNKKRKRKIVRFANDDLLFVQKLLKVI